LDDKPLIIDGEQPEYYLTLHTYREWSKRLAVGLKEAGFKPGDRLLLFSGNTIFFSVVQFATIMAGGIFTGANPTYVAREVAYQLRDSGATFFLVGEANLDAGLQAAKDVNLPLKHLFLFDSGIPTMDGKAQGAKGVESWTSLIASPKDGAGFKWEEFTTLEQMNRCCVLNYSSGTTGLPKGVELSHYNYVANCMQVNYVNELKSGYEEWRQRARSIAFLPLYREYHIYTTVSPNCLLTCFQTPMDKHTPASTTPRWAFPRISCASSTSSRCSNGSKSTRSQVSPPSLQSS
jgi:long-subunit acyl-CoA synthetase (AMP-forming)